MRVYRTVAEIDFRLEDLPVMPRPKRVLLAKPDHFQVAYVINPHMEGNVGEVDRSRAAEQWRALRQAYESLSIPADTLAAVEDLPDLVFIANQTLPFYDPTDGTRGVVLSRMHAPERRDEVAHVARFFRAQGYEIAHLSDRTLDFEGMGDAIWHTGRHLIWGGYGFRTTLETYDALAHRLEAPVIALRLVDERFYHLDTCFSVLDEQSVLIFPGALEPEGVALIRHFFPRVIEAPENEAVDLFACNAHCPDEQHVFIQRGCTRTNEMLREAGFEPVELDTDEFLKSGGSVFCMKQMFW